MADRFWGKLKLGGNVTKSQLDKIHELCDGLTNEEFIDGQVHFIECLPDDFFELCDYCKNERIALQIAWDRYHDDGMVEFWLDGAHSSYLTDSFGEICIRLSDLKKHEDVFIGDYLKTLCIPVFPPFALIPDPKPTLRTITVYYSDGDTTTTTINGTDEEIGRHYLGHTFEAGCDTKHHVALAIHFHDTGRKMGLRVKNIESSCVGTIASVRIDTTKIDDTESITEIMLPLSDGTEYALSDVWVYDLQGEWLQGIGYRKEFAK